MANNFISSFKNISFTYKNSSNDYNNNNDSITYVNIQFKCFFLFAYSTDTFLYFRRLLVPFDEPVNFINLALLITFTLALVQALLSMIGAVIACLWSPCCIFSPPNYTPIPINSHYAHTTTPSHRFEVKHHNYLVHFSFLIIITST